MTYNEAETRFYLIDPILRQKGYDDRQRLKLETPAPVEPTGPRGRRRRGSGRTDYLFCVQVGEMPRPLPVAVLLADILDKVHEISIDHIEDTHFFTLSQVYEDLLLKMGEKNSDGGQFFTRREVIRAMAHAIDRRRSNRRSRPGRPWPRPAPPTPPCSTSKP